MTSLLSRVDCALIHAFKHLDILADVSNSSSIDNIRAVLDFLAGAIKHTEDYMSIVSTVNSEVPKKAKRITSSAKVDLSDMKTGDNVMPIIS
jgi:hypothetical protein